MWIPGQKIGAYTVVRKLGEGGMGLVYEAVHDTIGRRVALKVLHPELSLNPLQSRRFFNEARAANRVVHAGLVQIYDVGEDSAGASYLIMELVGGESLESRLRDQSEHPAPLSPAATAAIGQKIAEALTAAHSQGVVHRDIKPADSPGHNARLRAETYEAKIKARSSVFHGMTSSPPLALRQ